MKSFQTVVLQYLGLRVACQPGVQVSAWLMDSEVGRGGQAFRPILPDIFGPVNLSLVQAVTVREALA